ncbi:symporter of Na+/proline [Ameyamaea chiangmaiensis NBRC 103196]|uniref:Sodium:proline symporter n=1 Tax=Ameyamaea chiangmaiensis TaxID=442969 RepID=A0A850PKN6_9PROT|nr:sodium:solute symporter [Ameyamaea chiangmaiensis]MBS4076416.1 sodium:solute symporter [Ameyamaea chiangmaiensis]NVN41881.1 sodium:proline symporter [Ameyamaea chiangmaiensis]GBQ61802.1 symporter of Na+/proline [Ameyamaea chiangmaiensis NBRC 103196]
MALLIVAIYLLVLPAVALALARRGGSGGDYLGQAHDLPWWALCLSLVATETSTLTVISVPGVAYGGGFVFVGLACGYLVGRGLVAWQLLPRYRAGGMASVYHYLGQRFGAPVQALVSATFLLTRVLAEGVRLFAGALPVVLLLRSQGIVLPLWAVLAILVVLTALYTVIGGLRAVIWSDAIQLALYMGGSAVCVALLWHGATPGIVHRLAGGGRLALFHTHTRGALVWTDPFTPLAAVLGGAVLTVASHGTDQLLVQRALAARTLGDARRAMVASAGVVGGLFALLSAVGVLLWDRAGGAPLPAGGPDALFPSFIVHDLPSPVAGLMIAGVLAATMGSLSATLNAMAGATVSDFGRSIRALRARTGLGDVGLARLATVVWALILIGVARGFAGGSGSAVLFGLSVAAYAYGAMLGAFLLGMLVPRARGRDVVPAFLLALAVTAMVVIWVRPGGRPLAFSWLVPLGAAVEVSVGALLARRTA